MSDAKNHIVQTQFVGIEAGGPRPDHPDFKTGSELAKDGFSGIRANSLTNDQECWVNGEILFKVSELERNINPTAFEEKYAEHFGLTIAIIKST